MGRHDAYSYHSESGTADGTPGTDGDGPVFEEKECDECRKRKETTCSRSGSFANRELCTSCVNDLQEQELRQKRAKARKRIRQDAED